MEMKVNVELLLAFYKQRVADLEHELIIQKAVNEALKAEIHQHAQEHNKQEEQE